MRDYKLGAVNLGDFTISYVGDPIEKGEFSEEEIAGAMEEMFGAMSFTTHRLHFTGKNEPTATKGKLLRTFAQFSKSVQHPYCMRYVLYGGEPLFIYGQPGEGKTHIAVSIAMALAYGEKWNGCPVFKPGCAILYYAYERQQDVETRFRVVKDKFYPKRNDPPVFITELPPKLTSEHFVNHLANSLVELRRDHGIWLPVVVVIDTLRRAMPSKMSINSSDDTQELFDAMKIAQSQLGVSPIFVTHAGKDEGRGITGSINIEAVATTVMLVSGGKAIMEKCNVDAEAPPFPFDIEVTNLGLDRDGEPITAAYATFPPRGEAASTNSHEQPTDLSRWARFVFNFIVAQRKLGSTVTKLSVVEAVFNQVVAEKIGKDPNFQPMDFSVSRRNGNKERATAEKNVSISLTELRAHSVFTVAGTEGDLYAVRTEAPPS